MPWVIFSVLVTSVAQLLVVEIGITGTFVSSMMMLSGGIILLTSLFLTRKQGEYFQICKDRRSYTAGIFAAGTTGCVATAVILSGVAPTLFIIMLSPAFAVLIIATGIVKAKIPRKHLVAVSLAVIAACFIFISSGNHGFAIGGLGLALLGSMCLAGNYFVLEKLGKDHNPRVVASHMLLVGGITLFPWQRVSLDIKEIAFIITCGICYALANICLMRGIKKVPAQYAIFASPLGASFSSIGAYFVFGETIAIGTLIGFLLGLSAIFLVGRADHQSASHSSSSSSSS